jgi:hypothetical protein
MTEVLLEHLDKQPGLYLNEMVAILHYQCGSWVSEDSVQRTLAREGWTKKQMRQKAQEQNPRLRAFYQRKLSKFQSHQLVFLPPLAACRTAVLRCWSQIIIPATLLTRFQPY